MNGLCFPPVVAVWVSLLAFAAGTWAAGSEPAAAAEPAAAVVNPHVSTDHSIDCSTVDRILAGLVRKDMTDEEKVLAVFHWVRRLIYHGDGLVKYAYNFHNMIHIFGHGSCLRQTTPMWVLLSRLGYKCRNAAVGGHHVIEVSYGGQWHLFDPHMNFFVYTRSTPRAIASIEQIKADATLVTEAVKDGRACPGFLLCGDDPGTFATRDGWKELGDFPEARKYTPVIEEPFGRIALRRGETYTRTWMPGDYWFRENWGRTDTGPRHGCGRKDQQDTVNWPLYEPHAWGTKFRHWGAGSLVYKPDLGTDHYADAVVEQANVKPGVKDGAAALLAAEPGKAGEAVFSVGCPYVITAGELKLRPVGADPPTASVSTDRGKTWKPLELKGAAGERTALFISEVNGSFDGYWLKLSVPAGGGVAGLELKSHFQLNPYSLPYLLPGKNIVRVQAVRFSSPLAVTWSWSEGDGWKTPRSAAKTFTADGEFALDVAGPKYPRMESLVLSVAP